MAAVSTTHWASLTRPGEVFSGPQGPWRAAFIFVFLLTVLRILLLLTSTLELYPDEAQYWVWSRRLALGYFSKPPMIAWLIHFSTTVGGDAEAWVRMPAPLLHGVAALALAGAGRSLYGGWSGFWGAVFYSAMPGVQLSSAVIATDAPLMAFLALSVWAYAVLWTTESRRGTLLAAGGLGLALGLAFLSKYAALYMVAGLLLHAAVSAEARNKWSLSGLILCLGTAMTIASPNIVWNAQHHFQTVAHTAANADIGGGGADADGTGGSKLFGARGPFGFLLGQFGVFGPVPFAVLILAATTVRRGLGAQDRLLACLVLPALGVVFAESVIARANANWAVAAYAPGAVLVAGLVVRWRAWRTLSWGLAVQGVIAAVFALAVLSPTLTDAAGAANAFKRARGWKASAQSVVRAAQTANAQGGLSAVATDDRFLFNALSYYARNAGGAPAGLLPAPPRMWVRLAKAANQAEAETPLDTEHGQRVLIVSANPDYRPALVADFAATSSAGHAIIPLDRKHRRDLVFLVGERFQRRPRDPVTGLPTPP